MDFTSLDFERNAPHPITGRPLQVRVSDIERARAGNAAYRLARDFGYGKNARDALRRCAHDAVRPGESAKACAIRVVPRMHQSATVRAPGPEAA